ncbi:MAG: outer membrane beta-barrel protein [Kofleriaceae bacterium]
MRAVVAAMVTLALAGLARAEVEVGGVVGVHTFSDEGKLGVVDETDPESLRNSSLFAGRVGVMFGLLGIEAELGVIPTEPRGLLFDVTALTYRAHLVAQYLQLDDKLIPFAFIGAGVIQTVDSQNEDIVQRDKVVAPYLGIGAKYRTPSDWGVRLDVRALLVPKVDSGVALDTEILIGVYKEFGRPRVAAKRPERRHEDPDNDGIAGAADRCPLEAEDIDSFEDTDGCSDRDNDQDGVPDAADSCVAEPEDKTSSRTTTAARIPTTMPMACSTRPTSVATSPRRATGSPTRTAARTRSHHRSRSGTA